MRSLCLPTITTSDNLWIQRVWAPDKSAGPKNSLVTTSKSIIVKAKLTELLMPCLNTPSGTLWKKTPSEQRSSKSCTVCNPSWPIPASQASVSQPSYRYSTKSSSAARTFYPSYISFGTGSKPNWVLRALTKSASVPCIWGSQSCRNQTTRLGKLRRKDWKTTMKKLTEYYITRGYLLSQKPSKQSSSVNTTTTRLKDILALTRQES